MQGHADDHISANASASGEEIPKIAKGAPKGKPLRIALYREHAGLSGCKPDTFPVHFEAGIVIEHLITDQARWIRGDRNLSPPSSSGTAINQDRHKAEPVLGLKTSGSKTNTDQRLLCAFPEFLGGVEIRIFRYFALKRDFGREIHLATTDSRTFECRERPGTALASVGPGSLFDPARKIPGGRDGWVVAFKIGRCKQRDLNQRVFGPVEVEKDVESCLFPVFGALEGHQPEAESQCRILQKEEPIFRVFCQHLKQRGSARTLRRSLRGACSHQGSTAVTMLLMTVGAV